MRILHPLIFQSNGLKSPWPDGEMAPYDGTRLLTIDFLFGEFWVSLCEGRGFNQVASNTLTSTTFTTTNPCCSFGTCLDFVYVLYLPGVPKHLVNFSGL